MIEPNWWDSASCKGLWYEFDQDTETNTARIKPEDTDQLRKICAQCPVRESCLEDALIHSDEYTFRAGFTAKERQQMMKKLGIQSWTRKQIAILEKAGKKWHYG